MLLSRGPYDKNLLWDGVLEFKKAVRAGYVVINQDTRGRSASEGEWLPWKHEREDGYDTEAARGRTINRAIVRSTASAGHPE